MVTLLLSPFFRPTQRGRLQLFSSILRVRDFSRHKSISPLPSVVCTTLSAIVNRPHIRYFSAASSWQKFHSHPRFLNRRAESVRRDFTQSYTFTTFPNVKQNLNYFRCAEEQWKHLRWKQNNRTVLFWQPLPLRGRTLEQDWKYMDKIASTSKSRDRCLRENIHK